LAAAPLLGHAEPRLEVSPRTPRPGDPVLVTVRGVDQAPKGTGGKVPLVFFQIRDGWQAVFAVPISDGSEEAVIEEKTEPKAGAKAGSKTETKTEAKTELKIMVAEPALTHMLTVTPRKWAEEKVTIAPEMAEPPPDKRKLIDGDNAAIIAALRDRSPPRFTGKFAMPGGGGRTSTFGAWRTLNGDYRSRHLGVDLAARKGAAVRAVQDGEVTLVRDGFLTGGTVVVAHGAGIASAYFHLDGINVKVGDTIKRGTTLGAVGLTGRTTGPHIHVGIWVPGGFIDPDAFLRLRFGAPVAARDAPSRAAR
jgi:murein DD-endopeptidase MepM/ murein hydrolase activator NlpD